MGRSALSLPTPIGKEGLELYPSRRGRKEKCGKGQIEVSQVSLCLFTPSGPCYVEGMPIYTLEEVRLEIGCWKKALKACATGKSYVIGTRQLTRYDLPEIRKHLEWLASVEASLSGQGTLLVRPLVRR